MRFSEISTELANLPNISAYHSQPEKNLQMPGCLMVTHFSINYGLGCLTSVIWPFTLPSLLAHACIVQMLAIQGWVSSTLTFSQGDNKISNLNASMMYKSSMRQQ